MTKYIIKRIISALLTLFIILTLVFFMMRMVGGSPVYSMLDPDDITPENVAALEAEYGFDKPLVVQYVRYLGDIARGEWGKSYFNYKGVFENMRDRWEPTIMLAVFAFSLMFVVGIPLGVLSATHRNSPLDYAVSSTTLVFQTIPGFWFALLTIYLLAFKLHVFPLGGYVPLSEGNLAETLRGLVLPAVTLSIGSIANVARHTRAAFLGVLKEDYIRTAKAKGLPRSKVLYKHGLKNSISLITSILSNQIAGLLGGSVVVEKIFGIEGIGKLCIDSLSRRDYSQQQVCVLATAAIYVGVNIIQDIVYKLIDPRIDYTK